MCKVLRVTKQIKSVGFNKEFPHPENQVRDYATETPLQEPIDIPGSHSVHKLQMVRENHTSSLGSPIVVLNYTYPNLNPQSPPLHTLTIFPPSQLRQLYPFRYPEQDVWSHC